MASVLQVATIKDQGGNANAIEIANSSANVTIGNLTGTAIAGTFNGTIGSSATFPSGSISKIFTDTHSFSGSSVTITTGGIAWSGLELDISSVSTSDTMLVNWFIPDVYNNAGANRRMVCRVYWSNDSFSSHQAVFGSTTDIYQDLGQINQNHVLVIQAGGFAIANHPATSYKVRLFLHAQTDSVMIGSSGYGLATIVGYNIKG